MLLVLEDAHWGDPTTLELMGLALERIANARVLMLLTSRPDDQPALGGHPHVTRLTLTRLGRGPTEAIVAGLASGESLPPGVLGEIAARTDGVPLFVEELTKAMLEAGTGTDVAVPASLHASLMARLDRVPGVKEVAQVAACLGREFDYPLLAAVSPVPEPELRAALDRLAAAELVFARGEPPEAGYSFKHALVRDAVHESLLKAERQRLHARIARVLEERFPEVADAEPELLARHCVEAGLHERAVDHWRAAARQSVARSAMAEAVVQARNGLEALARLPAGDPRSRRELELQGILAAGLLATIGNAAEETGRAYARARALCEECGDTETLAPILGGLCTYHQTRGEFASLRQVALELLRLGEEDAACELIGSRSMALCLVHVGDFASAREHLERVLRVYRPEAHGALTSVAAFDMRAVALSYLALDLLVLGFPAQARDWNRRAVDWTRTLSHPHTLAFTLHYGAAFHLLAGDAPLAEPVADELRVLAGEHRFPVWLAGADVMRGCLLADRGAAADGFALARAGLASRAAARLNYHQTFFLGLFAERCLRAGELGEAQERLGRALALASDIGERWFEAELHRLRGELLLASPEPDAVEAEACLRRALAVARTQEAGLWELRAATSLARLWHYQGRRAEARDLLAPVYSWFTEGFDTADLRNAKVLLDEVR